MSTGRSRIVFFLLTLLRNLLLATLRTLRKLVSFLVDRVEQVSFLKFCLFDFTPRPDDIFIVTYPRSGTTWMQMILYQLTTDGQMDFAHISQISPWFEREGRRGRNLKEFPSPRLIKSHLRYSQIPQGPGKYIYVARDGKDVAASYFRLHKSHRRFQGSFAEFFDRFMQGNVEYGKWADHVAEWWAHRHDPNVLFIRYEDLSRDLTGCIQRVADFCGIDLPAERLPQILERCSFSFMKEHEAKFDPLTEMLWENGFQPNTFLRKGQVGHGQEELNDEQILRFEEEFSTYFGNSGLTFDADVKTSMAAT